MVALPIHTIVYTTATKIPCHSLSKDEKKVFENSINGNACAPRRQNEVNKYRFFCSSSLFVTWCQQKALHPRPIVPRHLSRTVHIHCLLQDGDAGKTVTWINVIQQQEFYFVSKSVKCTVSRAVKCMQCRVIHMWIAEQWTWAYHWFDRLWYNYSSRHVTF